MAKLKVVHYINQFFAQIGGEEKADYPAEIRVGEVVGPGMALTQKFGDDAEIVATIICGDSYFNENLEKAKADILAIRCRPGVQCRTLRRCMRNDRRRSSGRAWNPGCNRYVCRESGR